MVSLEGVEPSRPKPIVSKTIVSASSTTNPYLVTVVGLEPTIVPLLRRLCMPIPPYGHLVFSAGLAPASHSLEHWHSSIIPREDIGGR